MDLSDINNVCIVFDKVKDLASNGDKLFVVEKEEVDLILYFTNPNETCFVFDDFQGYAESIHEKPYIIFSPNQRLIHEDECFPRAIIPNPRRLRFKNESFSRKERMTWAR